jgi:hypothetical protein
MSPFPVPVSSLPGLYRLKPGPAPAARAVAAEGLRRISLEAVDGWTLRASAEVDAEDRGPFARLLGAP